MKLILASLFLTLSSSLIHSDECKNSRWGEGDEIGNANLISSESVLKAANLIKTGKVYSLGLVVDAETPAYPPRSLSIQVVQPTQQFGNRIFSNFTSNDDVFQGWFGIGSQLDGLGHIGDPNAKFYNCFDGREIAPITGLTKLGIEKVPPLVARGVLFDMASLLNVDHLKAGQTFSVNDLKAAEKKQGVEVRKGDIVLFHTGWTDAKLIDFPEEWGTVEPGITPELAEYLAAKQVIAVGADTWGLDVVPPIDLEEPFPGHVILLKENGIYILEGMNTGALAKDKAYEFLFVLGQAKVKGAVQMFINPIAIR
tara:strand:- start:4226 stop:5158 length:933 start_codon:yes stop_codon:yes gene_type:complete